MILAEPLQLTVENDCLNIALSEGVMSLSTIYQFSVLLPSPINFRIVFETLNKIIEGKKSLEVKASELRKDKWLKDSPPLLTKQNRGNPSQLLAAKFRLISGAQIIIITR